MSRTQFSQTPPSISATSVCHFFSRPKRSLHPRLAFFLSFSLSFFSLGLLFGVIWWPHRIIFVRIPLHLCICQSGILVSWLKSDDGCKSCHGAKIMERSLGALRSIPRAVTQPHPSEAFICPVLWWGLLWVLVDCKGIHFANEWKHLNKKFSGKMKTCK